MSSVPEAFDTLPPYSDAAPDTVGELARGCADCGRELVQRIDDERDMQLEALGVWCPGCGGWICDDCRERRHGVPMPFHVEDLPRAYPPIGPGASRARL